MNPSDSNFVQHTEEFYLVQLEVSASRFHANQLQLHRSLIFIDLSFQSMIVAVEAEVPEATVFISSARRPYQFSQEAFGQTLAPHGPGRPRSASTRSGITRAVPGAAVVVANGDEDKGKDADFGVEDFKKAV